MNKYFYVIVFCSISVAATAQPDSMWLNANALYTQGRYEDAAKEYATLIDSCGIVNADLYYNAANAYYKQNEIARAILYYEKALKITPDDDDVAYNLAIAQQHTIDKIDAVPTFFVVQWLQDIPKWTNADTWGILSLSAFALMLALIFIIATGINRHRKTLATLAVVMFICSMSALWAATRARQNQVQNTHAIIMLPVSTVKASPDDSSTDLFILHEGTKVQTLETIGKWVKIKTADGNQGWVQRGSVEQV
jgi:hypothetical protein